MDLIRETLYKFFDLPFHKRVEIAKELQIFSNADLELKSIEATQKWSKRIIDENLINELNNLTK